MSHPEVGPLRRAVALAASLLLSLLVGCGPEAPDAATATDSVEPAVPGIDVADCTFELPADDENPVSLLDPPGNPEIADLFDPGAPGSQACAFDSKNCAKAGWYHTGVDISNARGTPIKASNCGKVSLVQPKSSNDHGMGNAVILEHVLANGAKIYTLYAHMDSITPGLSVGAKVARGQQIGTMGGSGYGSATYWPVHLHLEFKSAPVLNNPTGGGPYWGYTPTSAINFGYYNPGNYIGRVDIPCAGAHGAKITSSGPTEFVVRAGGQAVINLVATYTGPGTKAADILAGLVDSKGNHIGPPFFASQVAYSAPELVNGQQFRIQVASLGLGTLTNFSAKFAIWHLQQGILASQPFRVTVTDKQGCSMVLGGNMLPIGTKLHNVSQQGWDGPAALFKVTGVDPWIELWNLGCGVAPNSVTVRMARTSSCTGPVELRDWRDGWSYFRSTPWVSWPSASAGYANLAKAVPSEGGIIRALRVDPSGGPVGCSIGLESVTLKKQ